MELVRDNPREWQSKCIYYRGTMEEIAEEINEINANPDRFVIATHQPQKVAIRNGILEVYETLIFTKEKTKKESGVNEVERKF